MLRVCYRIGFGAMRERHQGALHAYYRSSCGALLDSNQRCVARWLWVRPFIAGSARTCEFESSRVCRCVWCALGVSCGRMASVLPTTLLDQARHSFSDSLRAGCARARSVVRSARWAGVWEFVLCLRALEVLLLRCWLGAL